ncbi:hypothetical protein PJ311_16180 [Bacillus sp. CLL-7-23]|uniref:Group-specific protein n=1 Tax=Bacillus changyiensis TaxID=3004103 RepID=A0ABT4X746_9BACI|nr:hypothetical protein [Bacillus changyiensis]MDA7028113.1 hypothetical protein [Bacillus changyiensis]
MYLEPSDYDNVVVLIKYNKKYQYYVTDKELWVLDLNKLKLAFQIMGYQMNLIEDERMGFDVLTKEQYSIYKDKIKRYEVNYDELKDYYQLFQLIKEPQDDIREILPLFYIDFDKELFYSFYTEPGSYEEYIPDGWQGILTEELEKIIPRNMVYWRE